VEDLKQYEKAVNYIATLDFFEVRAVHLGASITCRRLITEM
jgi:hypothetical protein